ncbi:GvpL/GvpF family gas vesicle protein [Streptomyces sp. NPDC001922]|uniref:GvpL/GvpF family gas vesicle protein n=1 Tax=Streptomyces sp. NPDC001922 TaxID=3364624 RepID=UPI0036B7652B
MTALLQYVYAVTRSADCRLPEDLRGIGGAPVAVVEEDGLAAAVTAVPAADFEEAPLRARLEDLEWLERTARAHQHVVDAVAATGCALPLRLATVYRDERGVRQLLTSGRERFGSAFALLEGRDEWGVKIYTDSGPAAPANGSAAPAGTRARPASGRDYLRQRQQQRKAQESTRQQADDRAREAHEALARLAERSRLHRPQDSRLSGASGQNVLNGAYLVDREEAAAFRSLVSELAGRAAGLRIELTGPWAPYSFTSADSDAYAGTGTGPANSSGPTNGAGSGRAAGAEGMAR